MGRYLDKGKDPDRDDPDGLPARGIKMGGCLAHHLDKLFAILAEHTEFADLMRILRSITTNIHKSSQVLDHCKACSTVSGRPWNQLDAMVKTRWWSLFTCGYTQVRCVRFVFGALVCHGNFGLRVSLKKL